MRNAAYAEANHQHAAGRGIATRYFLVPIVSGLGSDKVSIPAITYTLLDPYLAENSVEIPLSGSCEIIAV